MFQTGLWIGESGQNQCYSLAFDGAYIYAGLYTSPAKVVKIDPVTMTAVSTWTAPSGENYCQAVVSDGFYIYAEVDTTPNKIYRLDPVTMSPVAPYLPGVSGQACWRRRHFS